MITVFGNEDLNTYLGEVLEAKIELENFLNDISISLNISNAIKEITNINEQSSFDRLFNNISRFENKLRCSMLEFYEIEDRLNKENNMSAYKKLLELRSKINLFLITDINNNIKSNELIERELLLIAEQMKEFNNFNSIKENSNKNTSINENITVETGLTVEEVLEEEGEYLVYLQTTDYYKKNYRRASGLMSLTKMIKVIETGNYEKVNPKSLKLLLDITKHFVEPLKDYNIFVSAENYDTEVVTKFDISEVVEDTKDTVQEINIEQEYNDKTLNNEIEYKVKKDGQMSLFG